MKVAHSVFHGGGKGCLKNKENPGQLSHRLLLKLVDIAMARTKWWAEKNARQM